MGEYRRGNDKTVLWRRPLCGVRRTLRRFLRLLLVSAVAVGGSGIAHAVAQPVEHESPEVVAAARAVTGEGSGALSIPPGFQEVMGYRPVGESVLMDPSGGCSTPLGSGPHSFEAACQVHDYGYDLLRYAEHTGGRLGPWARLGVDRRLYRDLRETCRTPSCKAKSSVYFAALTVNSVRQGYRAPTDEPPLPWTLGGLVAIAITMGIPLPPAGRNRICHPRRDRKRSRHRDHGWARTGRR